MAWDNIARQIADEFNSYQEPLIADYMARAFINRTLVESDWGRKINPFADRRHPKSDPFCKCGAVRNVYAELCGGCRKKHRREAYARYNAKKKTACK